MNVRECSFSSVSQTRSVFILFSFIFFFKLLSSFSLNSFLIYFFLLILFFSLKLLCFCSVRLCDFVCVCVFWTLQTSKAFIWTTEERTIIGIQNEISMQDYFRKARRISSCDSSLPDRTTATFLTLINSNVNRYSWPPQIIHLWGKRVFPPSAPSAESPRLFCWSWLPSGVKQPWTLCQCNSTTFCAVLFGNSKKPWILAANKSLWTNPGTQELPQEGKVCSLRACWSGRGGLAWGTEAHGLHQVLTSWNCKGERILPMHDLQGEKAREFLLFQPCALFGRETQSAMVLPVVPETLCCHPPQWPHQELPFDPSRVFFSHLLTLLWDWITLWRHNADG